MKQKEKEEMEFTKTFQQKKISLLNRFFMKNIVFSHIYTILIFIFAVVFLVLSIYIFEIANDIKITLISMLTTYILTTSKTIIDKTISTIHYLLTLLTEEQRGLNSDIGIEIDKVDLDKTSNE